MIVLVGLLGMAVSVWRGWGEAYTMFLWFQTVALTVLVGYRRPETFDGAIVRALANIWDGLRAGLYLALRALRIVR